MSRAFSFEGSIPEVQSLTIEQLIQKAGGFGRFQWAMMIFGGLARQGATFFFYTLAYLELVPKLECKNPTVQTFETCEVEDICDGSNLINRDLWRIDYSDYRSFHNWMTDLELYCYSDFMIGLLGSIAFLGFAFSGLGLKQSDRFGRKKTILVGTLLSFISIGMMFFWRNLYAKYVGLLIFGFISFKDFAIYILVVESLPKKSQIYAASWVLSADPLLTVIPATIFLMAGGKQLQHFYIAGLVMSVLSFFLTLMVPESPKYLLEKGKYGELRKNLAFMARFNGVSMGEYQIEGEIIPSDSQRSSEENSKNEDIYNEGQSEFSNRNYDNSRTKMNNSENNDKEPLLGETPEKEFSVWQELKDKRTLLNLICVIVIFCVVSFNFYMISFYLKYVEGNIYINTLAGCISEIAGNFGSGFIQKWVGSKKALIVCFALSLVSATPLIFITNSTAIAVCVFSGKFFIEGGFNIAYFVNPEIFHPLFVSFSFGLCNLVANIFTIFAPQVAEIKPRQTPVIVLLVLTVVTGLFTSFFRSKKEAKNCFAYLGVQYDIYV
ncbi:unnamed protein product [Moneuplotes crassus]|uniref:Uncharacterized protein n=1 Tax=Euplotes crassus TaxID=5936 RepID=A0AAD1XBE6_EUPCR|nr:unnamed protein product [Moneuplotes crassus]